MTDKKSNDAENVEESSDSDDDWSFCKYCDRKFDTVNVRTLNMQIQYVIITLILLSFSNSIHISVEWGISSTTTDIK